jgi:hypothetical protein
MTRRIKVLLLIAELLLVAAIVTNWPDRPDPPPRSVDDWVEFWRHGGPEQKAAEAVRALWKDPIAALPDAMNYDPRPHEVKISRVQAYVPNLLHRPIGHLMTDKREARASRSRDLLRLLGPDAAPAVPALERLAKSTNFFVAERAIEALMFVGPPGLPSLIRIADDPVFGSMRKRAVSRVI